MTGDSSADSMLMPSDSSLSALRGRNCCDVLLVWSSCFPQVEKYIYDLANLISQSNYLSDRRFAANHLPQPESADIAGNTLMFIM